ncbi:MAG: 2,3-diphosphoglycerate-dependent phosphoglycerate mutase [Acidimicrobiales bacterium]
MATLVLLRHGESTWNRDGRFTGWADVGLTRAGVEQARAAGRLLAEAGLAPSVVHTSLQVRAVHTAELVLAEMGRSWIPVRRHWRLNERHYGALEGLDKRETSLRYGEEQVFAWRRSYSVPPPPLEPDDPRHPRHDERYAALAPDALPSGECLADVIARVLPYWHDAVVPDLRAAGPGAGSGSGAGPGPGVVLVAAHGNSLRALVKHLDGVSDDDICELNIPTGFPLVYSLGADMAPEAGSPPRYLGDPAAVAAAAEAVRHQAGAP